jgi:hypothetical protein
LRRRLEEAGLKVRILDQPRAAAAAESQHRLAPPIEDAQWYP